MKKRILVAAFVTLGLLGITTIIRAQASPITVSAGSAQTITLPTNSVTLTGTASSTNGAINAYAWTEVSGGTATITNPTAATTLVNNLVQGSYTFRVTVTDSTSVSSSADVSVTVNRDPANPTVAAGNSQTITLPVSTITLSGLATASTGRTISSYKWAQTSGPITSAITTPSAATTSVTGLTTPGTYVFTLTSADNIGAIGVGSVTVVVNPSLVNPVVNAGGAQTITLPVSTITLSGLATASTGRTIFSYNWVQTSGPTTSTIISPASATTVVNNLTQGVYRFTLTATDNTGVTGAESVTVLVNTQAETNPIKNKTQLEINSNGKVNLKGIILSVANGVLTTNVWGITFTINTTMSTANFLVGDLVQVNGTINPTASTPTITARTIKDVNVHFVNPIHPIKEDKNGEGNGHKEVSFGHGNNGNGNAFGRNN